MTSVRVYHVGSANSISTAVAAQNGAGLQWSARDDGVDGAVVKTLKKQAGAHGHCPETDHRAILAAASLTPRRRPLAELLAAMPDVGRDDDFERRDHGGVAADFLELVLAELAAD